MALSGVPDLESGTGIDISLHSKGNFSEFSSASKDDT